MDGVRLMMQNMLDQQRHEFMDLITQELANARGEAPMINELIVVERLNNGPVPSCLTTV